MGDVELPGTHPEALGPSHKLTTFYRWSERKSDRLAGNEHEELGRVTEAVVAKRKPVHEIVRNMV